MKLEYVLEPLMFVDEDAIDEWDKEDIDINKIVKDIDKDPELTPDKYEGEFCLVSKNGFRLFSEVLDEKIAGGAQSSLYTVSF